MQSGKTPLDLARKDAPMKHQMIAQHNKKVLFGIIIIYLVAIHIFLNELH